MLVGNYFFGSVGDTGGKVLAGGFQGSINDLLVQPVSLLHPPPDEVAIDGPVKVVFRNAHHYLHRDRAPGRNPDPCDTERAEVEYRPPGKQFADQLMTAETLIF